MTNRELLAYAIIAVVLLSAVLLRWWFKRRENRNDLLNRSQRIRIVPPQDC